MPTELVNNDFEIAWLRIDGMSRGAAKAFFASEWGVDFTEVRVSKDWFSPPKPMCDECCERPATCGAEMNWAGGGPSFKEKVCDMCQGTILRRESLFSRLDTAEARTLAEVTPYDGWEVEPAGARTPGAVAYWHGEVA